MEELTFDLPAFILQYGRGLDCRPLQSIEISQLEPARAVDIILQGRLAEGK